MASFQWNTIGLEAPVFAEGFSRRVSNFTHFTPLERQLGLIHENFKDISFTTSGGEEGRYVPVPGVRGKIEQIGSKWKNITDHGLGGRYSRVESTTKEDRGEVWRPGSAPFS